ISGPIHAVPVVQVVLVISVSAASPAIRSCNVSHSGATQANHVLQVIVTVHLFPSTKTDRERPCAAGVLAGISIRVCIVAIDIEPQPKPAASHTLLLVWPTPLFVLSSYR